MDCLASAKKAFNPEIEGLDHLRIYQSGELVSSWDRLPPEPVNQKSITKSVIAIACLMLIERGDLRLDDSLADLLCQTELCDPETAELWREVQLFHCLTMSAGQKGLQLMENYRLQNPAADWLDCALHLPLVAPPGRAVRYTNSYPYIVGLICDQIVRRKGYANNLSTFLCDRLFAPLGISAPAYITDPQGRLFGSSGIMLTTDDIAKIGLLLANKGLWRGQQILAPESVREMTRQQLPAASQRDPNRGYGFFTWSHSDENFFLAGIYGQLVYYIKAADILFACNGHLEDDEDLPARLQEKILNFIKEL